MTHSYGVFDSQISDLAVLVEPSHCEYSHLDFSNGAGGGRPGRAQIKTIDCDNQSILSMPMQSAPGSWR